MKMNRVLTYVGTSTLLAGFVIARAFSERVNVYSALVFLQLSNGSLLILFNFILICCLAFLYGLQRLLYGPLRPAETEALYEKAWYAVTETLLAMTIFREEIGVWFALMFLGLLAGKVWQWIGEGRVEYMEQQPPANPRVFYTRLSLSLFLSILYDLTMVRICLDKIIQEARPGINVMFTFEYALLLIASIASALRFCLGIGEIIIVKRQTRASIEALRAEMRAARGSDQPNSNNIEMEDIDESEIDVPGWEEKGRWVFYLELVTDFVRSLLYCGFFFVLLAFHGLPIHILRDLFLAIRSFVKRIHDFVRYRQATKDMDRRYPDATGEDLSADNTCIVCREDMVPWDPNNSNSSPRSNEQERRRPKKLPCGHILHFSCLRSWLERQQTCPTCRAPVLAEEIRPPQSQTPANQPGEQRGQQEDALRRGFMPAQAQDNPRNPPQPGRQPNQQQQPFNPEPQQRRGFFDRERVVNLGPIRFAMGPTEALHNPPTVNNLQDLGLNNGQASVQPGNIHSFHSFNHNGVYPSPHHLHSSYQTQANILQNAGRLSQALHQRRNQYPCLLCTQHTTDMAVVYNRINLHHREISEALDRLALEYQILENQQSAFLHHVSHEHESTTHGNISDESQLSLSGGLQQHGATSPQVLPPGFTLPPGYTAIPLHHHANLQPTQTSMQTRPPSGPSSWPSVGASNVTRRSPQQATVEDDVDGER